MNPVLPDEAVEFGQAAARAIAGAGGTDLARQAEGEPSPGATRARVGQLLSGLGLSELDPTADLDTAAAAGELCRVAGSYALPYPVVPALLAVDGRPVAVGASEGHTRVDHFDLFPEWLVLRLDGPVGLARPVHRLGTRLGPFVGDLEARPDPAPPPAGGSTARLVALQLTLSAWYVLGGLERAVALAVEHVSGRVQFDQPLAGFQAVQFQLADASTAVSGLQELARFSLWRLFADPEGSLPDALALRVGALDAARAVLRTTQQLHGAAGLCDEYDVSILCRHLQPYLRLPFGAERSAEELFGAVARQGFEGLFPHGPARPSP